MKYKNPAYNGTMQALSAPGKLDAVRAEYKTAHTYNLAIYAELVKKHDQLISLAVEVYGSGSSKVRSLRDAPILAPPKLIDAYKKLEKKFYGWRDAAEAKRQAEIKRREKAERSAQRWAERAKQKRIQRQERQRQEAERLAEQREKSKDYRRRFKEARAILESLDYKYGIDFRDNAISFARKHIEEIRPCVWQRIIPDMEDLEPSLD
jgi:hypothetical protein